MTLLTVAEAAAELRISYSHMKALTARCDIDVVRIGRRVLITPDALDAFVQSRTERQRGARRTPRAAIDRPIVPSQRAARGFGATG